MVTRNYIEKKIVADFGFEVMMKLCYKPTVEEIGEESERSASEEGKNNKS